MTKKHNINFQVHGVVNLLIHIPALFATMGWGLVVFFVGYRLTGDPEVGPALSNIAIAPLFAPLVSCTVGIIRGAKYRKQDRYALRCLLMSVAGVFLWLGMIAFLAFLGSIG